MTARSTSVSKVSGIDSVQFPDLKTFLESAPPGTQIEISDIVVLHQMQGSILKTPELQLDCENASCNGPRFFSYSSQFYPRVTMGKETAILDYQCRNCGVTTKTYALQYQPDEEGAIFTMVKVGEWPPFGQRLPSRLVTMLRDEKDLFQKGKRSENQGLGIGAFAYYRRVVESQKNSLFDEIIKVAKQMDGTQELITELKNAKKEVQFSKAVKLVKHGIPQSLLIKDQNPLLLLHKALSDGIHNESDLECLRLATDIRFVLIELSEKLASALSKNRDLETAVRRLSTNKS